MFEEILPCPYCGGKARTSTGVLDQYMVICTDTFTCGVRGPYDEDRDIAIEKWNALPRELVFTKKPPKVAGSYWNRSCLGVRILEIGKGETVKKVAGWEWAGPIPLPK